MAYYKLAVSWEETKIGKYELFEQSFIADELQERSGEAFIFEPSGQYPQTGRIFYVHIPDTKVHHYSNTLATFGAIEWAKPPEPVVLLYGVQGVLETNGLNDASLLRM